MPRRNRSNRSSAYSNHPVEILEQRLALTPNLTLVDAYLMDQAGTRVDSAAIGERVGVRFDFFVEGLPSDSVYTVAATLDGVTHTRDMSHGAGASPRNWWNGIGGWFVREREYEVTVTVDSSNVVAESNEADNSFTFQFTPQLELPPSAMLFPLEGEIRKDFSLGGYVDVDNSSSFHDYRGGKLAYEGHRGIDVTPVSTELVDAGIPVLAAADGVVIYTQDGESDFGGGPANGLGIDHGNG